MTEDLAPETAPDALSGLRRELADLVGQASGFTAEPFVPARIVPPVSVVTPGAPYLTPGNTYGSFLTRLIVTVVMATKANESVTTDLDTALTDTVVGLANGGYRVEQVGQPYPLVSGGGTYVAADITLTKTITL